MGSELKMDRAYIDTMTNQAICCWTAPDITTVEDLFKKAGIWPESIKEVSVYSG